MNEKGEKSEHKKSEKEKNEHKKVINSHNVELCLYRTHFFPFT